MVRRFLVPEVSSLATHDFLSALEEHHLHYKELLVLSHMLCGHLEGSAFRYLLLLAQLVDCMPWASIKEFAPWATLVYPSLQVAGMSVGCPTNAQSDLSGSFSCNRRKMWSS